MYLDCICGVSACACKTRHVLNYDKTGETIYAKQLPKPMAAAIEDQLIQKYIPCLLCFAVPIHGVYQGIHVCRM